MKNSYEKWKIETIMINDEKIITSSHFCDIFCEQDIDDELPIDNNSIVF